VIPKWTLEEHIEVVVVWLVGCVRRGNADGAAECARQLYHLAEMISTRKLVEGR
jgi:hypothetical protein